jgi:hypothetical protein
MIARLLCLLALGLPGAAWADPITLIAIGANLGFVGTAALVAGAVVSYGSYALLAANFIYGGMDARRRARNQSADARRAYNAGLQDRNASVLQADPPWRVVYGACRTGGDIVAIFTSDKTGTRTDGTSYTKPDGLKHLVIVVAAHEVDDITEMYIDGVAVGALDGSGWATAGDLAKPRTVTQETSIAAGATFTFPGAVTVLSASDPAGYNGESGWTGSPISYTVAGAAVTNTAGITGSFSVTYTTTVGSVRWGKQLGTSAQAVDAYLTSVVPAQWTAADRLRGLAYVVVTLDLEDQRFQGGPPQMAWDVRGRKVYDPRTTLTVWTQNPALIVRDYLLSAWGFEVAAGDIDNDYVIAAANACDVSITFNSISSAGAPSSSAGATYTCNGALLSSDSRERVLNDLCDAMGGYAVYGARWQIMAGVWTAPVLALTDSDLAGQIEIVQAGVSLDEVFNGVRGGYVPADGGTTSDFTYANATFVAADGRELWTEVSLPYTNTAARCRNLARIMVEANRDSQVIRMPCTLRAWPLQVGDRVTVTSAEYGFSAKTYRVTDWAFGLQTPVMLTLQEDAAAIYDQADAAQADPAPNTALPRPWLVDALGSLTAASADANLVIRADGTLNVRVRVTWPAIASAYVVNGGRIEVRWRSPRARSVGGTVYPGDAADAWRSVVVPGDAVEAYIDGAIPGDVITISAAVVNGLGVRSDARVITHTVVGKLLPPSSVSAITWATEEFGVRLSWPSVPDRDVVAYELRTGASWETATVLDANARSGWLWRVQTVGSRTVLVKARDSSGGVSATAASAVVVIAAPSAPIVAYALAGAQEVISWTVPVSSFAIDIYELRYGATWAGGTPMGVIKATVLRRNADFSGSRIYWVAAVDVAGNVGTPGGLTVTIMAPGAVTSTRAEVVDNNALLYWGAPVTGSLPVERYEVRKGVSWAGGAVVGSNGNSTFTTIFEQQAGVYSYWVAAVDSAGTAGTAVAIVATINQPPDYVLRNNYEDDWSGITLNGLYLEAGKLYGPALNETIQTHFESRSWATPDAQIVAGYPLVFQPSGTTAYLERTMDYGTALPATVISATLSATDLSGALTTVCQLSYKALSGDPWIDGPTGDTQVLASGFRYAKVRFTFTGTGGDDLVEVAGLNIKLSGKLKTDSGSGSAVSTDVGGTVVTFGVAFIDVNAIVVTPSGTTARYALYDFVDAPNPTSFKVLLFDSAGARVSGGFSWTARGF